MRYTVSRTTNLSFIDPVLPPEIETVKVEGADSFEEAVQELDKKITERIAVWKQAAELHKEKEVTPKVEPKPASEVTGPAQTNEVQGQVEVTGPEVPEVPAETPAPVEEPKAPETPAETPAPAANPAPATSTTVDTSPEAPKGQTLGAANPAPKA